MTIDALMGVADKEEVVFRGGDNCANQAEPLISKILGFIDDGRSIRKRNRSCCDQPCGGSESVRRFAKSALGEQGAILFEHRPEVLAFLAVQPMCSAHA